MRHGRIQKLLGAYLDGELEERKKNEIAAHLLSCAGCRRELESLKELDEFARSLAPPLPSEHYVESFPSRVAATIRARSLRPREREVSVFRDSIIVGEKTFGLRRPSSRYLSPPISSSSRFSSSFRS